MGAPGQVAGQVGQSDSYKHGVAVTQEVGRIHRHQFGSSVFHFNNLHNPPDS